jgi:hypothetical protein
LTAGGVFTDCPRFADGFAFLPDGTNIDDTMKPICTRTSRPLAAVIGLAALYAAAFPTPALGYGKNGNQTVGAITVELIQGSNAETKVKALPGTETLSHASKVHGTTKKVFFWSATANDEAGYKTWSTDVTTRNLRRAGWRRC